MSSKPHNVTQHMKDVIHHKLNTDLEYFARDALKITTKEGTLEPLILNKAQLYLHQRAEKQLRETGMVRLIVVKGRRQGMSTYVAARFYHKTRQPYKSVFILSHIAPTTKTLFKIVKRYHTFCPGALRQTLITDNEKELGFKNGSQYIVSTAGSGSTGRGDGFQFFHGSEVAFYENTDDIKAGALKAVADVPGTEIFLESTANGVGNFFHQITMDALENKGRYEVVFIPWFWEETYRSKPPADYQCTTEEEVLKQIYNIDDYQIYWRRLQIIELGERLFRQEFPFTVHEAFQSSGSTFINPIAVEKARKTRFQTESFSPIVLGVDPARDGDRTVLCVRQGRKIIDLLIYQTMDTMTLVGIIEKMYQKYTIGMCFIDYGMGVGTYDRLKQLKYENLMLINFGASPIDKTKYRDKKAEMAFAFKDWLDDGPVSIPDNEDVATDILAVPDWEENNSGQKFITSKEKIKKTYGKSTDIFDACCLTFAFTVKATNDKTINSGYNKNIIQTGSPFRTAQRRKELR